MSYKPKCLWRLNLYVRDVEGAERFYAEILGLDTYGRRPGHSVFMSADMEQAHEIALMKVRGDAPEAERGQVDLNHMAWKMETFDDLKEIGGGTRSRSFGLLGETRHIQPTGVPVSGWSSLKGVASLTLPVQPLTWLGAGPIILEDRRSPGQAKHKLLRTCVRRRTDEAALVKGKDAVLYNMYETCTRSPAKGGIFDSGTDRLGPRTTEIFSNRQNFEYLFERNVVFVGSPETMVDRTRAAAEEGLFNIFVGESNLGATGIGERSPRWPDCLPAWSLQRHGLVSLALRGGWHGSYTGQWLASAEHRL